jgi:hypothetical protein
VALRPAPYRYLNLIMSYATLLAVMFYVPAGRGAEPCIDKYMNPAISSRPCFILFVLKKTTQSLPQTFAVAAAAVGLLPRPNRYPTIVPHGIQIGF